MQQQEPETRRSLTRAAISLIGWCGLLGALTVCFMGLSTFVAPDFWFADNMSFFLTQYLMAGLAGVIGGLLGLFVSHRFKLLYRFFWLLSLAAFAALVALTSSRTQANTVSPTPLADGRQPLKIISINIEHLFLGDEVLTSFLERENADIVVMQEVLWWLQERRWERLGLTVGSTGQNGFPEHLQIGELGGLAVYSRFPILKAVTKVIQGKLPAGANVYYDADRELLSLTLDTGDTPLQLVVIHPDSPRTEPRWQNKRDYLDELDEVIERLRNENSGHILAIGDWNSSPWSGRFQETLIANKLATAYPGGWPRNTRFFFDYRLHKILGAPVDQFGASSDLQVVDVTLGPDIGSDHLPLIVELGLVEPGPD
ncbi:endonuclease/exonuclease/phosphatase family protein [uncultured Roseibium sp.]|uniref:endonuclease/exonuclease/phosphatase family protein n=1 Tax=uncultured Roseibium sp. TaxID=1936171 RepID=UPI00261C530E|nr:endonuclease/exonuclease/phosphatase family protein [uncultured Roseibium sp.]